MRTVVMSDASREERQLTQSFGLDADGSWITRSKAAAVLVGGDFSIEYPIPVTPKVHVRLKLRHVPVQMSVSFCSRQASSVKTILCSFMRSRDIS